MSLGKTFLKNASMLMSGTIGGQLITFVLSFVLARMYGPTDFGRYTIFAAFAGVLAAAATGAFERVILLADSFEDARKAATLTLLCSTAAALAIIVVGLALSLFDFKTALPLPIIDIVVFIPIFVLCYGYSQVFIYSSLREDRVRSLAIVKILQSATMGLVQVAAASLTVLSGLVVGNVAGWLVSAAAGLHWRRRRQHIREDLCISSISQTVRENWRYPRYVMPAEMIDNLSNQLPVLLIGVFLSVAYAGLYGLAIMMLSAPAAVAGQAIGQSFMQYLGKQGDESYPIKRAMYQIWSGLAVVGLLPFGSVLLYGPQIFEIAFGSSWHDAGGVAQALAILLFVRFISSPTSTVYLKLGMQKEQMRFCIAAVLYRTAAYSLGAAGYDLITMIWVHVASEVIAIFLYNFIALRRLKSMHLHDLQVHEIVKT